MIEKKIVLCGIQEQGKDIISFLYEKGIKVTHIVTITKNLAKENHSETSWVSYSDVSLEYDIPIYYAKSYSLTHDDDVKYFTESDFDILLLGGWQRLISSTILNTITFPIGQHGSSDTLPRGRGRSPINWSILLNNKRLIWNLFLLDNETDSGDVVDSETFDINEFDDCETIYFKVSISVKYMLVRTIPKLLDGSILPKPQLGEPSYYPKRTPKDGYIDWNSSVYNIYNLVRSVTTPYPGAYVVYNGEEIKIWKCQIFDTKIMFYEDRSFGEIVEIFDDRFIVNCSEGLLLVTEHDDDNIYIGKIYN
jgi:methionyl-tRNA formyltransferase